MADLFEGLGKVAEFPLNLMGGIGERIIHGSPLYRKQKETEMKRLDWEEEQFRRNKLQQDIMNDFRIFDRLSKQDPAAAELYMVQNILPKVKGSPELSRSLQLSKPPVKAKEQYEKQRLNRLNELQEKKRAGTIAPEEQTELTRSLQYNKPLMEFGTAPPGHKYLTEPERVELARKGLNKPLTPVEKKGITATIEGVVPAIKKRLSDLIVPTLPPSPDIPRISQWALAPEYLQGDIEKMWEQVMEETGYRGMGKVAQKQIEAEFDRYIKTLNKSKGVTKLANQYEWDRKKWEAKQPKPEVEYATPTNTASVTKPKELSEEDRAAIEWANANPDDPRAKKILSLLGTK